MSRRSEAWLASDTGARPSWHWPPEAATYETAPELSSTELTALRALGAELRRWRDRARAASQRCADVRGEWKAISRLLDPLADARLTLWTPDERAQRNADDAVGHVLLRCAAEERSYWSWDDAVWIRVCGKNQAAFFDSVPVWGKESRQYVIALAYLFGNFTEPLAIGEFERTSVARKVFGPRAVDAVDRRLRTITDTLGYRSVDTYAFPCATWEALLLTRSPDLTSLSAAFLERLRHSHIETAARRSGLYRLHRALAIMGLVGPATWRSMPHTQVNFNRGIDDAWREWVERWFATTTLSFGTRRSIRADLYQVGRWLQQMHPVVRTPEDWTRQVCADYVARVERWRVGDYVVRPNSLPPEKFGQPLRPNAKAGRLYSVRQFMRDCQEWEWMPRRFDPARALGAPRSIRALIGPDPRVIDDKVWAKLMWAGLNVGVDDFPRSKSGVFYPIELLRALTMIWLFSGLRSDEISRLRVGCIRWQSGIDTTDIGGGDNSRVCLLDVPTHKTGAAYTKPVDPLVGQAIEAWETVRPPQPKIHDRRTGALVDALFCCRGQRVNNTYINDAIIPTLCRKAGVPESDARGRITSHRARSTIASQLYNAKDPMTLFELQAWLGHRSPESTQHYARLTPTTLAKAYRDAGYFARNVRAIEVLIDRDAVQSGAAASGVPWQHFDLGHGYCTYAFFEQCPHRMACARCEFYVPKGSTRAQLLEAKGNLQRMLVQIPLTDDERAAVEEGGAAVERLLSQLADVPTPPGRTPRELGLTRLPMVGGVNAVGNGNVSMERVAAEVGEKHPA